MASTVLNDIAACILAVFLLFIGPIYSTYNSIDITADAIAQNSLNTFQKEVRKNGYIDSKDYIKFLNDLSRTGKIYEVKMIHINRLVYPKGKSDFEVHKVEYGTNQILETIKDGSKYVMKYGDDFKIVLKEKECGSSRILISIFTGSKNSLLSFSGGGMIENEVQD